MIVTLDLFKNFIDPIYVHVRGINEFLKFFKLVPYFFLIDGLGSDGKTLASDEICFTFITKIWITL